MKITKNNSALLVIDVINCCCRQECEIKKQKITYRKIRKMVPKLISFINQYQEKTNQPIIYINCTPWRKEYLNPNLNKLYQDPDCQFYSLDKSGFAENFFQIQPRKKDIIFTKNTYDAFTNPKLDQYLQKNKIKNLIIAGIFGDGCVLATIENGFSKGYNFVILKDLIETTDQKDRQDLQKLLKKFTWPIMFGPTINSNNLFKTIK